MGRRDKRSKRKVTNDPPSEAERLCKLKNSLGLSAKSDLSQLPEETTNQLYAMLDQLNSFQEKIDSMTPDKPGKTSSKRKRRGSRQKGNSNAPTSVTCSDRKKDDGASDISCSNVVELITTENSASIEGESEEDMDASEQHLKALAKQTVEQCVAHAHSEWLANISKSLVEEVVKNSIVSEASRTTVKEVLASSLVQLSVEKGRDVPTRCVGAVITKKHAALVSEDDHVSAKLHSCTKLKHCYCPMITVIGTGKNCQASFVEKETSSLLEADVSSSLLTRVITPKTGPGLDNSKPVHLKASVLADKAQVLTVAEKNNIGLSAKSDITQLSHKTLQKLAESSSLTDRQKKAIKRHLHKPGTVMSSMEQLIDGHRALNMTNTSLHTRLQSTDEITAKVQVSPSMESPTLDQGNKIENSELAPVPVTDKTEHPSMQSSTGMRTTTTMLKALNTVDNTVLQNDNQTTPGDETLTGKYPSRLHQALLQARRVFEIPLPASSNKNPPPYVMSAVIGGQIITSLCCDITPVYLEYGREKSIKRCLFDSLHPSGEYAIFENMPTGHFLTICNEFSNGFIVPWSVGKMDPSCKHILKLCSGKPGNSNSVVIGMVMSADKQHLYDSTENKTNKLKRSSKAGDFCCNNEIPTISRKAHDDFGSREAQMQRMIDQEFRKITEKFAAKSNQPLFEDNVESGSKLQESGNQDCWPKFHETNRYFELPDDQKGVRFTVTEHHHKEQTSVDGDCENERYENGKRGLSQNQGWSNLPGGSSVDDIVQVCKGKERHIRLAAFVQEEPVLDDNSIKEVNSDSSCSTPQQRSKVLTQYESNVPVSATCSDGTNRDGSRCNSDTNVGESSNAEEHENSEVETEEDGTASEQHLKALAKLTVDQCVEHAHNEWLANIGKQLVENLVRTTIISEASRRIVGEAVASGLMQLSVEKRRDAHRRCVENVATLKHASLVTSDGNEFAKPCPYTGLKCKASIHNECPLKSLVVTSRTTHGSSFERNISAATLVGTNKSRQGSSVEKGYSSQQDRVVIPAMRHKTSRRKNDTRLESVKLMTWAFANNVPLFTVAEKNSLGLSAKSDILQLPKKTLEKLAVSSSLTEQQRAVIKRHLYKSVIVIPSLEQLMNRLIALKKVKGHLHERKRGQMTSVVSDFRTISFVNVQRSSRDQDVVSSINGGIDAQPILQFNANDIERAINYSLTSAQNNHGRTDNTRSTGDPACIGHEQLRNRSVGAQVICNTHPNDRSGNSQSTGERFPHHKNIEYQSIGHSLPQCGNVEIQGTGEFLSHDRNTQTTGDTLSFGRSDETQRSGAFLYVRQEQQRNLRDQSGETQRPDDSLPRDKSDQTQGISDPIPYRMKDESQIIEDALTRGVKCKSQVTGDPLHRSLKTESTEDPQPRGRSDQTKNTGDLLNHSRSNASRSTGDPLAHVKSYNNQSTCNTPCIGHEQQRIHTDRSYRSSNKCDPLYTNPGQQRTPCSNTAHNKHLWFFNLAGTECDAPRLLAAVNNHNLCILKEAGANKRLFVYMGNHPNLEWMDTALNAKPVDSVETIATKMYSCFNIMSDMKVCYMELHEVTPVAEGLCASQFVSTCQLWPGGNRMEQPKSLTGRNRDFWSDEDKKYFAEKQINLTIDYTVSMVKHSMYFEHGIELIGFCNWVDSFLFKTLPKTSWTEPEDSQKASRIQRTGSSRQEQVSNAKQTNADSLLNTNTNSDKESLGSDHCDLQPSLEVDVFSLCQNGEQSNSSSEPAKRELLRDAGQTKTQLCINQWAKTNRLSMHLGWRYGDEDMSYNHVMANVLTMTSDRKRKRRSPDQFGGKKAKKRGKGCVDTAGPTLSSAIVQNSTARHGKGVKRNSSDDPTRIPMARSKMSSSSRSGTVGTTWFRGAKRPKVYVKTAECELNLYGQMTISGLYIYRSILLCYYIIKVF